MKEYSLRTHAVAVATAAPERERERITPFLSAPPPPGSLSLSLLLAIHYYTKAHKSFAALTTTIHTPFASPPSLLPAFFPNTFLEKPATTETDNHLLICEAIDTS